MVYVCRNPKDCLVSFYKFHQSIITPEMGDAPFEDFLRLAMDGEVEYGSYWEHLKSGWARRGHPNFKFVWFEDLKRETAKTIRSVGKFLGKDLSDEEVKTLCESTSIDTMRETSRNLGKEGGAEQMADKFFGKGEVGGWTEYFKEGEQLKAFEKWIGDNLAGTDITLPKLESKLI